VEIFFRKILVTIISTAKKIFCQVAELLMPRELCRKRVTNTARRLRAHFVPRRNYFLTDFGQKDFALLPRKDLQRGKVYTLSSDLYVTHSYFEDGERYYGFGTGRVRHSCGE
jgi:hypothetical protein